MFTMQLAGQKFTIDNRFPYVERLCQDYLIPGRGLPISVTDQELALEAGSNANWPVGYLESLAIYRKICEILLESDILLFHCSAIALDGSAFLFTAPSGTGKSTHARLWRQRFGQRVVTINDDKPLLSFRPDGIFVHGTPYAGKEHLQSNTSAPVAGILILHQATENTLRPLTCQEAFPMLFNQAYRKNDPIAIAKTMDLVSQLTNLPVFSLGCTISQDAVLLAYRALTGVEP